MRPEYVRLEVTKRCPLACPGCHNEGSTSRQGEMDREILAHSVAAATALGVNKFKFTGGEPTMRRDLPELVACACKINPLADLSIITAGIGPREMIPALYDAGLSRINLSIHGFSEAEFIRHGGTAELYRRRERILEMLLTDGRPHKINYVYASEGQKADLAAMLDALRGTGVTINVLDDLYDPTTSVRDVIAAVAELMGEPDDVCEKAKIGLPTLHYYYRAANLTFEFKNHRLGEHSPLKVCTDCPKRGCCKEGIFTLRVGIDGSLSPCLYRPELRRSFDEATLRNPDALTLAWKDCLREVLA